MPHFPRPVRYGALECLQVDPGDAPEALVVCLHGYGAPANDLVPIASEWIQRLGPAAERVRFVFPAAIESLEAMGIPGGRAWWPLNMARLMEAVQTRDMSELRQHEPPGMDRARRAVAEGIAEMLESTGVEADRLALGGFSQGAMLSMDVAIRGLDRPPAILFQYSGTLICEPQWRAGVARLAQTITIQSHGAIDPILPIEGAEALAELLKSEGVPVTYYPFHGPHTLTIEALDATADAILGLLES